MKKRLAFIISIILSCFLSGCYKEYDRTITVCEKKLYVERYSHRYIDVAYYDLTDSLNFRIHVGKFDNEHGGYSFKCQGDSIIISKYDEEKVINTWKYSLIDLRKNKKGF